MSMKIAIATVAGCVAALPMLGLGPDYVGSAATSQGRKLPKGRSGEVATFTRLPSLGSNAEAHGVNEAGTVVVGHSFDRPGYLYAVKWTLHNGSWVITTLPYPSTAARAEGVDNQGNVVGYDATFPRYPVLWPAGGGYVPLGCGAQGAAYGISADGQVVVGQSTNRAAAWHGSTGNCPDDLPTLGGTATAFAVSGDGSIIGGHSGPPQEVSLPVRWTGDEGQRQIQQLDTRPGRVTGANAGGDLAGYVRIPCALEGGCLRAVIWYAAGGSLQLETLGGEHSWARDINAQEEVVGISTTWGGVNTAYFWSASMGMFPLGGTKKAVANAVSDVRPDGTRLVVGMDAQANAAVWVVRNP